jgi:hypothetical protein
LLLAAPAGLSAAYSIVLGTIDAMCVAGGGKGRSAVGSRASDDPLRGSKRGRRTKEDFGMSTDYRNARTADPPLADRVDGPHTVETHVVGGRALAGPITTGVEDHDLIRWGPILAGVVTALAVMLFLTVLGIALGLSAFTGDRDLQTWGTAAGIWGGLSALLAFFFGGWMAGRGSAPGPNRNGVLNGFVTGALTLILLVWLATSTLTGVLGFFASTVTDLAGAVGPAAPEALEATNVDVPADPAAVEDVATDAGEAIQEALPEDPAAAAAEAAEDATPGAWGTVLAILLALGAAILGGVLGQANERTLFRGTRTVTT